VLWLGVWWPWLCIEHKVWRWYVCTRDFMRFMGYTIRSINTASAWLSKVEIGHYMIHLSLHGQSESTHAPQTWSGNFPARIQPIYTQNITFYPRWVTRLWHGQHLKNREHFIHVGGLYIKHWPGVDQVLSTIVSWPLFVTLGAKSLYVIQVITKSCPWCMCTL